ncbi:hypothetical protein HDU98_008416 [Podochytrium sp. JEL0797]|nr:hypothetical protein HDU98_008416 [Podochytrium sp. JEL0797]
MSDRSSSTSAPPAKRARLSLSSLPPPAIPLPVMTDAPELETERLAVHVNILNMLLSPEPQLRGPPPRAFDCDFKYHHLRTDPFEDLADDPDTDDRDRLVDPPLPAAAKAAAAPPLVIDPKSSVSCFLEAKGRKIPPLLEGRESRDPPKFSDGLVDTHPKMQSNSLVFCDLYSTERDDDAALLAAHWLARLGLEWGWPEGYRLASIRTTPSSGERWDSYLFGHPSGKKYRSPNEFLPHLKWLVAGDINRACLCKFCDGVLVTDESNIKRINYGREEDPMPVNALMKGVETEAVANLAYGVEAPPDAGQSNTSASNVFGMELGSAGVFNGDGGGLLMDPSVYTQSLPPAIPLATVDPSDVFGAPDPGTIEPPAPPVMDPVATDNNWNGSDYDSESDGSYNGDSSGAQSDGSESDGDNDDDDDDSGNESESATVRGGEEEVTTGGEESQDSEDDLETPLFPDLEPQNRKRASKKGTNNLLLLDPQELLTSYTPCRKGECVWYPTSHLNFHPPPNAASLQKCPFWPCLVLATPPRSSTSVHLLPLPIPSGSELAHFLDPTSATLAYPPLLPRSTLKPGLTPQHYIPHPSHSPIFSPRHVPLSQLVQWRLMDPSPPLHDRKYMCTDNPWQRRWNRGVIQPVGCGASWEPLDPPPVSFAVESAEGMGTRWRKVERVRWGVEVVETGDWVHLVLPCPFWGQAQKTVVKAGSVGNKHRLMKADRILYRSATGQEGREVAGEKEAMALVEGRRRLGKVVVEGDVYAFRRGVGWFWIGRKRCTMKGVVIGRRFGSPPGEGVVGDLNTNVEIDEVGDGFGQVGLVSMEERNVWEGWCALTGRKGTSEVPDSCAFLEVVKGLENQVELYPQDGYDFNYEEPSSEEEDDDIVLDARYEASSSSLGVNEFVGVE